MAAVQLQETQDNTDAVIDFHVHVSSSASHNTASDFTRVSEGLRLVPNTLFKYTLVSTKVWPGSQRNINKHTEAEGLNCASTTAGMRWLWKGKRKRVEGQFSHIVGAQRDPASAASAEFGLAIWAEVAAAIRKLGLAADTAGGRVVLLLGLLAPRLRPDATHLLFVALELLVQRSERGGQKRLPISGISGTHKLFVLRSTLLFGRSNHLGTHTFTKTEMTWRHFWIFPSINRHRKQRNACTCLRTTFQSERNKWSATWKVPFK